MPTVKVGDINMYYEVHGQGEALILIPGGGANGRTSWFRQLSAFKKHHRVITFDPRSIGKSSRPKEPYSFRVLADDVVGLMDHLAIKEANVLGQSMGGLVAQELAIDYPDRVLKLVLVSSSLAGGPTIPADPALAEGMGYTEGTTEIDFSRVDTRKTMKTVIGMSFNKRLYRKAMQFMSRFFVKLEEFDGMWDQIRAASGHNTFDRLHLIKAPTLVIAGAGDRIVPPHTSEVLAGNIPNARLIMVKDGSHVLTVEMTSRFNHEVLDFLSNVA
jgi:pimeloyl-ACP methyl ester carboxylesterase